MRRPHYIALGVVTLLTLIVLNLPSQTTARLKLTLGSVFLPLVGLSSSTQQAVNRAGDAITPRRELLRENEARRQENQQLTLQIIQAEELARENARLRQLLRWQEQSPWKSRLKLANVILRDPANWWRTVEIDLGSRDGVQPDLPVLTTDGLVGRISAVSLTRSQVVLLGDRNCKVAALVDETRDTGVIGATDPLDNSLLAMGFLSKNAALKPGQKVVTSGLGGIFPKGIPVGTVVDSRPVEYGLYNEARVKVAANLSALEEVWVLFP